MEKVIFFVILNECERSTGILRSAQNDVENFEELHFLGSFHSDFNEFTEFVGRASQQKSHILKKFCDRITLFEIFGGASDPSVCNISPTSGETISEEAC